MRKYIWSFFLPLLGIVLMSWGVIGHKTVATIADAHLTTETKAAIRDLLGDTSIADVSTWADNVRNKTEYKHTTPWHYVNVPLGLDYAAFSNEVKNQSQDNVYKAIENCKATLANFSASKGERVSALKFLIHFVGDLHQPMHVSRAEDKGGNTIQLQFDSAGTNLHSLWDGKLINKQGLSYQQLAKKIDIASPSQIADWQKATEMEWLYESYQISSQLYAEVDKSNKLGEDYYQSHIQIVEKRLEMAGIRLAFLLNNCFTKPQIDKITFLADGREKVYRKDEYKPISYNDIPANIESPVKLCVKISGHGEINGAKYLYVGGQYPNQKITIRLMGDALSLANTLDNRDVCIFGFIAGQNDKYRMFVSQKNLIERQ